MTSSHPITHLSSPSTQGQAEPSDTPRTDRILAMEDRGSGWLVAGRLEEHAKTLEREINALRQLSAPRLRASA